MEVRGQATQLNQESSSSAKLFSSPEGLIVHGHRSTTTLNPNQTLDQDRRGNRQKQQDEHRDGSLDPDPASVPDTGDTIGVAPNSKTTSTQPSLSLAVATSNSDNSVRYRECLKNHAASTGGHVLDGCGEFMPNGEEETPEALKCAACECHRSFHRKEEINGETHTGTRYYPTYHPIRTNHITHHTSIHPHPPPPSLPPAPPQQHPQQHKYTHGYTQVFNTDASRGTTHLAPMMMAFGGNGGVPAESSSEDLNMYNSHAMCPSYSTSKKRFRTRFTQDQKGKMHEFAEKIGWKIQKQDEQQLQRFCDEIGVKRQVFKVWMHNNKQATKKKQM